MICPNTVQVEIYFSFQWIFCIRCSCSKRSSIELLDYLICRFAFYCLMSTEYYIDPFPFKILIGWESIKTNNLFFNSFFLLGAITTPKSSINSIIFVSLSKRTCLYFFTIYYLYSCRGFFFYLRFHFWSIKIHELQLSATLVPKGNWKLDILLVKLFSLKQKTIQTLPATVKRIKVCLFQKTAFMFLHVLLVLCKRWNKQLRV